MSLAEVLINQLRVRNFKVALAESCTGGLVANRITDIPGASEVFWGGWVAYDNTAKVKLGVAQELISSHGSVSKEVALALAEAALKESGADLAIATTGIAGPGGGTPEKPVGLCYVAVAMDGEKSRAQKLRGLPENERTAHKDFFTEEAFRLAIQALENP